ncbi:hypothetical protein [Chloroflexus aggregans]|uniref:Colicin V production protein n=1 Tax=Chloroflexus aggregans (strain MD-66 / DSM 9485) TaxID=326427 RepID=B8G744_CHLAD|nr:hypothetical protein [Chloroflexus aggregans]ACL24001.1 hypothetical protein Cagg_1088 [Chloroflexus aggregans DSM 9485]
MNNPIDIMILIVVGLATFIGFFKSPSSIVIEMILLYVAVVLTFQYLVGISEIISGILSVNERVIYILGTALILGIYYGLIKTYNQIYKPKPKNESGNRVWVSRIISGSLALIHISFLLSALFTMIYPLAFECRESLTDIPYELCIAADILEHSEIMNSNATIEMLDVYNAIIQFWIPPR